MLFDEIIKEIRNFMEHMEEQKVESDLLPQLQLSINSVQLRQNLSREMHKLYGFDCFKVFFDLNPENSQFSITKLKTPTQVFELECEKKYEHQRSFKFMENPETGKVE